MTIVSNLALSVVAFYMIICANYLKELFGCQLQDILSNSMVSKHILGFILLVFLVVQVHPENTHLKLPQILGISVSVYVWFLFTTKVHYLFTLATIIILLSIHIIDSAKMRNIADENHAKVVHFTRIQTTLIVIAVVSNAIGFGMYWVEKRKEYKGAFNVVDFMLGKPKCRNFTPKNAKTLVL